MEAGNRAIRVESGGLIGYGRPDWRKQRLGGGKASPNCSSCVSKSVREVRAPWRLLEVVEGLLEVAHGVGEAQVGPPGKLRSTGKEKRRGRGWTTSEARKRAREREISNACEEVCKELEVCESVGNELRLGTEGESELGENENELRESGDKLTILPLWSRWTKTGC
ncbi:hypothetical protein CRG98_003900 [Punica granatum]|uniref:Uncharacterized protein n=1 Tax=Punica granatum TaxID=22663 RepID=A0A2I0L4R9_PUNGR|nr:hypothetical protein CRG98_003900 [Punica granatum]